MAQAALGQLSLQKILWLPTGAPAYRNAPVASAPHRVAMLRLALEGEPRFEIDARELAPGASGYTVDTLKALRVEQPDAELYLLLGADQLASFERWREPAEVARLARLAVFARPGFQAAQGAAIAVPMKPVAVSASDIRARVAHGEDISQLVPPAVAHYIAGQRLYR
jgi:nicotinate-nucleotide adenylyltransferase